MTEPALPAEWLIRLGSFAAVFAAVAVWEILAPRRVAVVGRGKRWPSNLGVVVLNTVLIRLLTPIVAVALALLGREHGWGLLNHLALPGWAAFLIAILALDLAIYLQHVLFHAVPTLWRLHRMHHADLEFDVTTGLRFHPVEIALSTIIKLVAVALLGAPPL